LPSRSSQSEGYLLNARLVQYQWYSIGRQARK
jgi:hypothetical protein